MAKKYEFQPDRPYSNWLNKLQLTKLQQKQLLKWCLYGLLLIVLSVLQDVVFSRMRIWGGTTDLIPCAIFTIGIREGTQKCSVFALTASILYLLSGSAPGTHVLVLITILAVLAEAFRQTYLQPGILSTLFCVLITMAIYEMSIFGFCMLVGQVTAIRWLSFLVPAVLSVVVVPVIYPVVNIIGRIGGEAWNE